MKFGWMKEAERLIPCKIVYRGGAHELLLHHLSAADMDEAERKYPPVKPPTLLGDDGKPLRDERGVVRLDEGDVGYITAAIERAINHASYLAVLAVGAENFEAREIEEQMKELRREFTRTAIITIRDAALADAMLTPAVMEAAKESVAPFASTPTE
jgi:hypothetical protein